MTSRVPDNKRRFDRYDTDVKIQFYVSFDVRTKVDYRIKVKNREAFSSEKYHGVSKNISAEGLCFLSGRKLNKGDRLLLEVYVPTARQPIVMEGEARWCRVAQGRRTGPHTYETGVKVLTVNNEPVEKTVFVDTVHNVVWSIVLESVFTSFKHIVLEAKRTKAV